MKGTIVGVSVFFLLTFAVAVAAVGAVSQAYNGAAGSSLASLSATEYEDLAQKAESEGGIYQAFTFVCPFH